MLHFHHWLASAAELPALRFHQLQHHPLSAASSRLPPASTKQRRCGNIVSQALRSTETTMRWRYSVVSVANLTRCQGRQEPRSIGLNQSGAPHMQVRGSDFPRHATVGHAPCFTLTSSQNTATVETGPEDPFLDPILLRRGARLTAVPRCPFPYSLPLACVRQKTLVSEGHQSRRNAPCTALQDPEAFPW